MQTTRKSFITFLDMALLLLLGLSAQAADYYVDATTGNDSNNGLSAAAFQHIQTAINTASAGDTVHVAAGTYHESLTWEKNLTIQGAGQGRSLVDPSTAQGGPGGRCVYTQNLTAASHLDGFTLQNGSADRGGGMYNSSSSPTVTHCTFAENTATYFGGGMVNIDNSSTITNCTFAGNMASGGGGIFNGSDNSSTITNCTFTGNTAGSGGGLYNNSNSNIIVTNCTFAGNTTSYGDGGGIYNGQSSPILTNCTFVGNTATGGGGGGIGNSNRCNPRLTNCIVWGNSASDSNGIYNDGGSVILDHSDVQDYGLASTPDSSGNFAAAPLFVRAPFTNGNTDFGNLHLQSSSPCLNVGNDAVVTVPPFPADAQGHPLDLDGNPRIALATVDLGAYELPPAPDVSAQVQVTRGSFRKNLASGRFVQTLTLKNTGSTTISGPLSLVLDDLSANARLYNLTGTTQSGRPYLDTMYGLASGSSVTLTLEFTNPTNAAISYATRVLAGNGAR